VAKTATDIPITQGSGVNLSNFALASGRRRQTVILADADDTGEALVAELPAHDSVDRGSPLKIGGRASTVPFSDVAANDRTDAWLTLGGQLGAINTIEPATVYDTGRRAVQSAGFVTLALNGTSGAIVAATASVKTKVLAINIQCVGFSTVGALALSGSGINFWIAQLAAPGIGFNTSLVPGPVLHYATTVNTALSIFFSGNATFNGSVVYYQAP
jgi:hypothetical protein